MVTGELIKQNNDFVVVLYKEQVEQLGACAGDELRIDKLTQTFNDESAAEEIQTPKDTVSEQLKIAREVIAENREALRELAK